MADIKKILLRLLIVSPIALIVMGLLEGLVPSIWTVPVANISLGNVISLMAGIFAGEFVADKASY